MEGRNTVYAKSFLLRLALIVFLSFNKDFGFYLLGQFSIVIFLMRQIGYTDMEVYLNLIHSIIIFAI